MNKKPSLHNLNLLKNRRNGITLRSMGITIENVGFFILDLKSESTIHGFFKEKLCIFCKLLESDRFGYLRNLKIYDVMAQKFIHRFKIS